MLKKLNTILQVCYYSLAALTIVMIYLIGSVLFPSKPDICLVRWEPVPYESHENDIEIVTIEDEVINCYSLGDLIEDMIASDDKLTYFKEYKSATQELSDTPETLEDWFSTKEIELLYRVVETECHGGDFDSKVNVANVVLNRFWNGAFGDSLEEVITRPHQFSYSKKTIEEDTKYACMYAFEIEDTTNGAIAFHSNPKSEKFGKWTYVFTDNIGHHFYK